MHIVFSSYDDINNPFYGGGGAKAIHEVAKRLTKKHRVTVFTANFRGAKEELIDGVDYKRIGPRQASARVGQIIYQLLLPWYCHFYDFDVWIESFTPPISTAFLPLVTKKPVIGLAQLLAGNDMAKKYSLPFKMVEDFGLRFYKRCIVLTQEEKEKISNKFLRMKIFVIPNGVNEIIFNKNNSSPENIVLFLGRLDIHQKGIDLLVEAWKKNETTQREKLLIAGNGSHSEIKQLKEMIKASGKKNVKYLGPVSGKIKFDLFNKSKAIVVPSRFESFGITALEGMQFGKRLVTFDIKGLEWIPKRFRFIAKSFDTDSLSEAIKSALNSNDNQKYVHESQIYAKKFMWENISKEYEKVINAVD